MTMRDRRVLQAFPAQAQQPYMAGVENRLSALEAPDSTLFSPLFETTAEQSNIIYVGVQLREADGTYPTYRTLVRVWYAETQYGEPTTLMTEPDGWAITDDTGYFLLAPTYSGAGTFWPHVVWRDRIFLAPAITFA